MKRQSFQKKRRPTKGGLFVFHSKTKSKRRKKQRVAATASADLGGEVPNLGVARALLVILILHVAAIAAIFIHNEATKEDKPVASSEEDALTAERDVVEGGLGHRKSALFPAATELANQFESRMPNNRRPGESVYNVGTGDTYQSIAAKKGVDVYELRDLNNNRELKVGAIFLLPPARAVPMENRPAEEPGDVFPPDTEPELVEVPLEATRIAPGESGRTSATPAVPDQVVQHPEVGPDEPANSPPPPTVVQPTNPPNGYVVREQASTSTSNRAYTVKSGDTLWRIAQRNKVSVQELLKANGISDARKLRIGMTLKIPTQ